MQRSAAPQRAPVPRQAPSRQRRGASRHCAPTCAAAASAALRTLYPAAGAPRASGSLAVQAPHVLRYEEYGNAGAGRFLRTEHA